MMTNGHYLQDTMLLTIKWTYIMILTKAWTYTMDLWLISHIMVHPLLHMFYHISRIHMLLLTLQCLSNNSQAMEIHMLFQSSMAQCHIHPMACLQV